MDRAVDHAGDARRRLLPGGSVRPEPGRLPVRRADPVFPGGRLPHGVGRVLDLVVAAQGAVFPALLHGELEGVKEPVGEYLIAFLVLETLITGVFTSLDLFLFYIFFEGGLVPMF